METSRKPLGGFQEDFEFLLRDQRLIIICVLIFCLYWLGLPVFVADVPQLIGNTEQLKFIVDDFLVF